VNGGIVDYKCSMLPQLKPVDYRIVIPRLFKKYRVSLGKTAITYDGLQKWSKAVNSLKFSGKAGLLASLPHSLIIPWS
jgi:hypothetical protein